MRLHKKIVLEIIHFYNTIAIKVSILKYLKFYYNSA